MRLLLGVTFVLMHFAANAQKKQFQTQINRASQVTINGGETKIAKVDSVFIGQVIVDQSVATEVYFLGSETYQDSSSKLYMIAYKFAPKTNPGTFSVNITFDFDKPFLPWYLGDPPPPPNMLVLGPKQFISVLGMNGSLPVMPETSNAWSPDYKKLAVRGIVAADILFVIIRSKEKPYATISGARPLK